MVLIKTESGASYQLDYDATLRILLILIMRVPRSETQLGERGGGGAVRVGVGSRQHRKSQQHPKGFPGGPPPQY